MFIAVVNEPKIRTKRQRINVHAMKCFFEHRRQSTELLTHHGALFVVDLDGDGVAPNGHPAGFGISFPTSGIDKGDYFLRTDYLPNRLFRYDGNRWVKIEDSVRINMTNNDSRANYKTGFVNNTSESTINGLTTKQRQSLTDALKPKADN